MCLVEPGSIGFVHAKRANVAKTANVHIPVAHHDFAFGWSYCNPDAKSVMSVATGG